MVKGEGKGKNKVRGKDKGKVKIKIVFGWAVRVEVVQMSPALMWTNILFCLYLLSVAVRCDISARLIRPTDLYAKCYMGLLFDMSVSTSLISLLQCPIMPYSF
jgi:hypothetical protein